ncbi:MAG: nitroreductase family protein [Planctomycetota bacterium]|jgi:nitroreductase
MDSKSFLLFAESRRSIRKYTDQKVGREKIEQLIEVASWAPSNHNRQGWKFIVFEDSQEIHTLSKQTRKFMKKSLEGAHKLVAGKAEELIHYSGAFDSAPVLILVMHKKSPAVSKYIIDSGTSILASGEVLSTAMACQNLLLAAKAMGLGTCIMTAPLLAGTVWKSLDNLPAGFEPTCLITIGYPAETPEAPRRKKLEHIIEYR